MSEDLYAVLGIERSASEAEIKKAYRQQARKYHPDVNKDPGAEDTFKKIQKAYAILSDPQKKSQYDQFGVADDSAGGGGFGGGAGFEGFADSFDDIFDVFFGGKRGGRQRGPSPGEDLRYDLEITLEEAAKGIKKEIEIYHMESCDRCSGNGAEPGTKKTTCRTCNGQGQVRMQQQTFLGSFSQVSTCPTCHGAGVIIEKPCVNCHGKGIEKKRKKIEVDIPAGVDDGVKLRVPNEGNASASGGQAGDLYLFITVKKHKYFHREGNDIFMDLDVPYTDLILGTEIEVPTLTGVAKLKIPNGTQTATKFRLKSHGIPNLRGYGKGDQYVQVQAKLPKKLSNKEKELISELKSIENKISSKKNIFDFVREIF